MNEQQFGKLLINMTSIGNYLEKEELLKLLSITSVSFEKTGQFA